MSAVRLPSANRQAEIIQAVLELAAQQSPAEITTAEIARHLGLSQGALFRHYSSKDDIWRAVMEWVETTLLEHLHDAAAQSPTPLEGLQAVFFRHIDFVMRNPGVPRLIFNDLQQPQTSAVKQTVQRLLLRYRQLLAELLQNARQSGQIGAHQEPDPVITLFIGLLQGLVMQSMLRGDTQSMLTEGQRVFPLFLAALKESS